VFWKISNVTGWDKNHTGQNSGSYFLFPSKILPQNIAVICLRTGWVMSVVAIAKHSDFSKKVYFFHVFGDLRPSFFMAANQIFALGPTSQSVFYNMCKTFAKVTAAT